MRLIIMFDLPSVTKTELKNVRKWHNFLIQHGFIMMTESVYSRLMMNKSISESIKKLVRVNLPPKGDVQMLELTERQFSSIEYCLGKRQSAVVDSVERYVEI
jgi:CRISPR-associated protein Cas2